MEIKVEKVTDNTIGFILGTNEGRFAVVSTLKTMVELRNKITEVLIEMDYEDISH